MIARVTRILEVFEGPYDQLTLSEVSHRTRLPNSTTHRILEALIKLGWITQIASAYRLGSRTRIPGDDDGHLPLRSVAHPYLHALYVHTGMRVCLSALDGSDAVCIDRIGGGGPADSTHKVGQKRGLPRCAVGRAMLAGLSDEQADAITDGDPAAEAVPDGWTPERLHRELESIRRRRGLSVGMRDEPQDAGCVAVAIALPERRSVGVCLHSLARREEFASHTRELLKTARLIGDELNSHGGRPRNVRVPA